MGLEFEQTTTTVDDEDATASPGSDAPETGGGSASGAPAPVDEPTTEPDDEPDLLPAASTLRVKAPNGAEYDLTVDEAQSLMGLAAWANSLDDATRERMAAVEAGAAVPVSRADYERFMAWQQIRQDDPAGDPYADDPIDPRIAARLAALEQENQALRQQPLVNQYHQQANNAMDTFLETFNSYGSSRGLDPQEIGEIVEYAVSSGVIGSIAEAQRKYNPVNGSLLVDANYDDVARKAFDFAIVNHPGYHDRVFQSPAPQGPDPVAAKKARAGSLASAPSAAVATPPVDVRTMTPEQRRMAMAAEIQAAMSGR
jgi:hypothetical protein